MCLFSNLQAHAQDAPERPRKFGFFVGWESQFWSTGHPARRDVPYFAYQDKSLGGVNFGGFGRWDILPGFAFQAECVAAFGRISIEFIDRGRRFDRDYRFADVEVPLHFVWTNQSKKIPLRSSFLFGARIGRDFSGTDTDLLYFLAERAGLDIGLGVEVKLKKWKIQPELLYTYGLGNLHDYRNTPYDEWIGRVEYERLGIRVLFWRR
jgi:Outer membrane protein beta-barrel domain